MSWGLGLERLEQPGTASTSANSVIGAGGIANINSQYIGFAGTGVIS